MNYRFGDVVYLPFPNSDGTSYKPRPVLVLYNDKKLKQIQVAMISSTIRQEEVSRILVKDSDSSKMRLRSRSMIYLENVQTIRYHLVVDALGRCPDNLIAEIKERRRAMDDE